MMATTAEEAAHTAAQKRLKPTSFDDSCYQIQLHEHNSHTHNSLNDEPRGKEDDHYMQLTPRSVAGGKLKRSHSFSDLQSKPPSAPEMEVLTEGHLTDVEMLVEESGVNEVEGDDSFLSSSSSSSNNNNNNIGSGSDSVPMSPRIPFYGKLLRGMQKSLRVIFRCVSNNNNNNSSSSSSERKKKAVEDGPEVRMQTIPPTDSLMTRMASADDEVSIRQKIQATAAVAAPDDDVNTFVIDVPLSSSTPLLPPIFSIDAGKKCLVLDLDETLVHSTFQPTPLCDLLLPISLGEGITQHIYVCKRPGVDVFLEKVCRSFEVVIFTASLATYADPVIDFLDPNGLIRHRLFRESCVQLHGLYIKDLSRLGRPLDQTLIIDNSPASYLLQPENALAIKSWFNDTEDGELHRMLPMLSALAGCSDGVSKWRINCCAAE